MAIIETDDIIVAVGNFDVFKLFDAKKDYSTATYLKTVYEHDGCAGEISCVGCFYPEDQIYVINHYKNALYTGSRLSSREEIEKLAEIWEIWDK